MSLYEGAKTRVSIYSELSEEFEVKMEMHQGLVLSLIHFTFVIDVVTDLVMEGVSSVLLYADDLVLMSETFARLRNKFSKWIEAEALQKIGCLLVKFAYVGFAICVYRLTYSLCVKCHRWIHSRCAGVKRVTAMF